MTHLDWTVVAIYVIAAVGMGVWFSRKASRDTTDFFIAGRSLPWWIAGTSLVATTFSTDTPLFVAGLSRNEGVFGNWFWWSGAIASTATIFFFAKLWRRISVVTDIEFVVRRYDPSPARSGLRIFKSIYDGVFINSIVMASVTLAGATVIQVILQLPTEPVFSLELWGTQDDPVFAANQTDLLVLGLGLCAVLYSILSGLYGVVYTDLIQFALAMVGSFWLAIVVYWDASSGDGFVERLSAAPDFTESTLAMIPDLSAFDLVTFTFLTYVLFAWWGAAPGSGYLVQRLLATRSERDSVLAFLWYSFCHYVLRPWPWIIVGLASMIYFPGLTGAEAEQAYPAMINEFLAPGIKGVMVASMLAAYMSTLDTHLNWGASYLVNDLYQPFVNPKGSAKHYVWVSRIAMLVLVLIALIASTMLDGILEAYKYLAVIASGAGTVMILRWYWWRVTAGSEIVSLIGAFVFGNLCQWLLADPTDQAGDATADWFAYRLIASMACSTLVWIGYTIVTSHEPSKQAISFFRQVRPGGPGWRRDRHEVECSSAYGAFWQCVLGWLAATGFIYGLLFAAGGLLLSQYLMAIVASIVAAGSVVVLIKTLPAVLRE